MGKRIFISESEKKSIRKLYNLFEDLNDEYGDEEYIEYGGRKHLSTHGSPFDRGMSDSYYGRDRTPHKGGVGGKSGPYIEDLSDDEIHSYHSGYDYNEESGDRKDWGDDDFNDHFDDDDF